MKVGERMNRNLKHCKKITINDVLEKALCGNTILYETIIRNRTPAGKFNKMETPYQRLLYRKSDLKVFKIFGCGMFLCNFEKSYNLDATVERGIMVGWSELVHFYKL